MQTLELIQPDDLHLHFRDGDKLIRTVADTAQQFARAIVMPNLQPPVTSVEQALAYREQILRHIPDGLAFEPLMTLYLTDTTSVDTIKLAAQQPNIHAVKLYPAGATTHSDAGVQSLDKLEPLLAAMEEHGLPLLIHGEVTEDAIDIFDREQVFIDRHLLPIVKKCPQLKVVLEHISTAYAVDVVQQASKHLAATITAHHLWLTRNDMLVGGIKPHHYCLPIVKTANDRSALINAAISGNPKFFLGTDSAPHSQPSKESACGCAGIYTAHAAIELYAEIFEQHNALDKLEGFASRHGAQFYGLPINTNSIRLIKKAWQVPETLTLADQTLIPFAAGQTLQWHIEQVNHG